MWYAPFMDNMVTIAELVGPTALSQALLLKSHLEAEGIHAFIPDENTASVMPFALGKRGVRVQVSEEHAEDARKLFESISEGEA
jgi:hypothetical protein